VAYEDPVDGVAVEAAPLSEWTARLIETIGTPADVADDVAEILLAADRRGIASHGTARLPQYVSLVQAGVLDPGARPVLDRSRPALARFHAHNGWGHHAGRVAVDWAIDAARSVGSATAVVKNSNHYGIAGWYALRAAHQGLIGLSSTNASPLVAPTRARIPMLGTNPIAVAAPAGRHGTFCLDMATSTVPRGRIEVAARRGEALKEGWAIDAEGRPALTPEAALEGSLQPLGGDEQSRGYKGYGLSLVVDLLTGVLGGSSSGPDIVSLFDPSGGPSDLGHAFLVVDPAAVDDPGAFEARLERLLDRLIGAPTIPGAPARVLFPGEPEREAEALAERRGVPMDREHHATLVALGERHGLPFPPTRPLPPRA